MRERPGPLLNQIWGVLMLKKSSLWVSVFALFGLGCTGSRVGNYFPLTPDSTWTYEITSRSQDLKYQVTDKVVGFEYVPVLQRAGIVVDERFDVSGGGTRPMLYYSRNGYLTRLFGFDYDHQIITVPPWGRSEDASFLPNVLVPSLAWRSIGLPYGRLPGAFRLRESHFAYAEPQEVIVEAGHFKDCIRVDTRALFVGGPYRRFKDTTRLDYSDWYAPEVGLVKSVAREGSSHGAQTDRVELVRFSVAPATLLATSK
jgi:hypothetical protein